ncbi:MAG: TetR/AcrR family transcriptional regulator [Candidatus Geothermincolia bacterium]
MADKRVALDREERDRQLLEVAASVFAEKGYRHTSVAAITERAGVSHGTFYNYFESKQDVFMQLIELYFQQFEVIVEENHDRLLKAFSSGGDIIEAWRENVLSVFEFHAENPSLTAVIYREAVGIGKQFTGRMDSLMGLSKRRLAEEYGELATRKLIVPFDTELLLLIVNGTVLGTIVEWILMRQETDLEQLADNFVNYHFRALGPARAKLDGPSGERRSGTMDRRTSGGDRRSAATDRRTPRPEGRQAKDTDGGAGS